MKTEEEIKKLLSDYYFEQVEIDLAIKYNKNQNKRNSTKLLVRGIEVNKSISILERVLN